MIQENEILNLLLDRYERSGHCLPGKNSNRKVALAFTRGEYPRYHENDPCVIEINGTVQALADAGFITFTWRKGYIGWLLDKVYLNLDSVTQVYAKVGRKPLVDTADIFSEMLQQATITIRTSWKLRFLQDEVLRLQKNLRPSRLIPNDKVQTEAILKVLQYTENGPELMRVISSNCFHDSKYLERNLLPQLVSITKTYEPELITYRSLGEEVLTQSVVLEQLGILTYPEIFEFCGDVRLNFSEVGIDAGAFQNGFCLQSENLELITSVKLDKITTILLVENRTNYRYLILRGVPSDTLVIFHGGFYSPMKRKLFRLFAEAVHPTSDLLFWADIDLGGFLMFTRLKNDIFRGLVPWKMGLDDYEEYKSYGFVRSSSYLDSLRQRMKDEQFDPVFFPVADAILKNGTTVEQEIML
jgi:hypothetical protein